MKSKKMRRITAGALFVAVAPILAAGAARAQAVNEPAGINLGGTSFMDGFGRITTGFAYEQYFQIQHFNGVNGASGHNVAVFQAPSINVLVSLNQFLYVSPFHLFGGTLGGTAVLPLTDISASFASTSPAKLTANTGTGIGDLTWGPFLQFPPVIMSGRPVFDQRMEIDITSPIGSYDPNKDINPSSGFWSITPYWAMTVLPTPRTEISMRLNYLHNFRNDNPASSTPLPADTTTQAGDAGWINFAASYMIMPSLNVGLNGYYFKQFTDDQVNGVAQKGTEAESLSIGPGAMYMFNHANYAFINAYLPVVKRNTTSGFNVILRYAHDF